MKQLEHDKDGPNKQPFGNSSNHNTKKDIGKWCDFQTIPHHKTDECR
jgi:hypothetical protein